MPIPLTATPPTPPLVRQSHIINPSPKTRFREQADNITRHRSLVEMREFNRALDFACLQYQIQAATVVQDANTALAFGYKMLGVQEFITVLKTLSEEATRPASPTDHNLDHKV